jgi:hypothetical protein
MKIIGIKEGTQDNIVTLKNTVEVPLSFVIECFELDSPQMIFVYENNKDLFIVED